MKRIFLLICVLFIAISCEIQYDDNTKIMVTGTVVDENDNPLSDQNISVEISGIDQISFGKSDKNGKFSLLFPSPTNEEQISVLINEKISEPNDFQELYYIAQKKNFKNYKLDLEKIKLYKRASITNLRLVLNKISTENKYISEIKIEGKQPVPFIDLNPLENTDDYWEQLYQVIKNQDIILKYNVTEISNPSTTTSKEEIIPIKNEEVIYTINY